MIPTDRQTGYPSVDKPWLHFYKSDVEEKVRNIPQDITFYRFYRNNVFVKPEFPLIKYFNTTVTTKEFISLIEKWAKAFRAVGVKEDEMVPVYGTWCPDIAAIFFALNAIGAHPYFEKLDITEDALRTETHGAKVGVVFEALWNDVAKAVFGESRFEKVFMIGVSDSMKFPLKQIIALKGHFRKSVSDYNKYLFNEKVKELADSFEGEYEVPFKKDRLALITSSSGTTNSLVKGIMDSNESALSNVLGSAYSEPGFFAGKECLITLPPTASTAINCFFLLPLYMGMTIRIDPRAGEEDWPKLLLKYKPSLSLSTGSLWYSFYRYVDKQCKNGKKIDLSFADTFIMGGSGVTPAQLDYMNSVAQKCNAPHIVVSGYGCSEFFGVITVDKYEVNSPLNNGEVIDVGIPIPGAVIGIFDEDGNELKYNERGEIRVKGPAVMHGYFGKPETSQDMFEGEWLKTGDIGKIDENGYLYCYGRKKSAIVINNKPIFLFDVANDLRNHFDLEDCMLEVKRLTSNRQSVVVYYVPKASSQNDVQTICIKMNEYIKNYGLVIDGYRDFQEAFPISPTTLKPKTRYTDGFYNFSSQGDQYSVSFRAVDGNDVFELIK